MKLRARFALWFSLAALVPIAAAAVGTRQVVSDKYREAYERRQRTAESLAGQKLGELEDELSRIVESIAQRDGYYLGGLLIELEKYGGRLEQPVLGTVLQRLAEQGTPMMKAFGLDVMLVIDDQEVLFAPHYRPAQHAPAPERAEVARTTRGAPYFTREPILSSDQIRQELVIESARTTSRGPFRVTVVGGRIIDRDILAALHQDEAVSARVVDGQGTVLVALAGRWTEDGPVTRLPLAGPDGEPLAWLELTVSQAELRSVLRQVTLLAAGLGGAALLLATLLGLWVAGRMTRDLDELAVGAEAAARGDLDHEVPVRTKDEIGAVAESFNQMMLDLKDSKERLVMAERVAAWQEIARRLAHEIKNPLTPIQMSVETLRKTFDKKHPSFDEIFEESTRTVLEEAGRLRRIVAEFSEFARLPKPNKQPVDLGEMVKSAATLYQGSLDIECRIASGLPSVDADRDQLSQVIYNLLENARDALPKGEGPGQVRVTTRASRKGKAVAMVVEDSGPGIAAETRDRIFTPYYTTKHEAGGTGLGLAIVHRIVSDHGGRITLGDSDLGGARFLIELPASGTDIDLLASRLP